VLCVVLANVLLYWIEPLWSVPDAAAAVDALYTPQAHSFQFLFISMSGNSMKFQ
jgi:hypothetical protein